MIEDDPAECEWTKEEWLNFTQDEQEQADALVESERIDRENSYTAWADIEGSKK